MEEGETAEVCFFISEQLDHSQWHFQDASSLCTLILEMNAEGNSNLAIRNAYNPNQGQEEPTKHAASA